jgi:N-acetylmuramoyl-L-alanine amidase
MDSNGSRSTLRPSHRATAVAVGLLAGFVVGAGLAAAEDAVRAPASRPSDLAFTTSEESDQATLLLSEPAEPGDRREPSAGDGEADERAEPERLPVLFGTPVRPFVPLPDDGTVRAVRTETGVVLPVLERDWEAGADRLSALTACEAEIRLRASDIQPIGRAHVVLDPGHGGTEVGSVGPTGLAEKDINLQVAKATRRLLEERGATVVLTRDFDHNLTTATRGRLAAAIQPGLFVSIHHNGGAPPSGDQPGVMAYTKTDSTDSRRFGGLFYHRFTTLLSQVAAERAESHDRYRQALDDYAAQVADYDRRVAEWQAAQTATETSTTVPSPATTIVDGVVVAVPRAEVPEVGPAPTVPGLEPVRDLVFAGGGNRGVRSWIRPDGQDFLSILRTSGDVPAVLAEFLYLTNRAEEELLADPAFVEDQAEALTAAIVDFFSGPDVGITAGYVADEFDDQPIGGGGRPEDCVEPDYAIGGR